MYLKRKANTSELSRRRSPSPARSPASCPYPAPRRRSMNSPKRCRPGPPLPATARHHLCIPVGLPPLELLTDVLGRALPARAHPPYLPRLQLAAGAPRLARLAPPASRPAPPCLAACSTCFPTSTFPLPAASAQTAAASTSTQSSAPSVPAVDDLRVRW